VQPQRGLLLDAVQRHLSAARHRHEPRTGAADLHVRYGGPATTTAFDFRPYAGDANETVRVGAPRAGTWYVMVNGYTAYSGVSLTASW
jgi:hypothetical protein